MNASAGSAGLQGVASRQHGRVRWVALGLLALAAGALASLAIGARSTSLTETVTALAAFDPREVGHLVVRELRLPRTLVAILAGWALGVAGAVMQAMTRNPLAEPGLLGTNAGAALAVVVGISLFRASGIFDQAIFGSIGAGLAGVAVFALGRVRESGTSPIRLILAGAGLSVMLSSMTGIVILNGSLTSFDAFRTWSSGSIEGRGLDVAAMLACFVVAGSAMAFGIASRLNAIALGEDLGRALGADIRTTWIMACLSVMLLAGSTTAAVGPIGFIGLVAPHLARMIAGPDYRWILPLSAVLAANLLLAADVVGRVIAAPDEVAAGILAALLGGPFFIAVARRYRLSRL